MKFNKETAKLNGQKSKRGLSKTNQELRDVFQNVIESNEKNIGIWLNEAAKESPTKALELLLKISSFIMSKPKAISVNLESDKDEFSSMSDEELAESLHQSRRVLCENYDSATRTFKSN